MKRGADHLGVLLACCVAIAYGCTDHADSDAEHEGPGQAPGSGGKEAGAAAEEAGVPGSAGASSGSGGDQSASDSLTQVVGSDGGVLAIEGVEIVIPPGALRADVSLALSIGEDAEVTVMPDVWFDIPVTVTVDGSRWPYGGSRLAQHSTNGEYYLIGAVVENNGDSWSYQTIEFSSTRALRVVPASKSVWTVGDVFDGAVEPMVTRIPANVRRSDVTKDCLANASALFSRHDSVTPPRPPLVRDEDEYAWMTVEAGVALATAQSGIREEFPGFDIWVNGAWDSSGTLHGPGSSMHYFGAALDLALTDGTAKIVDPDKLGRLAPILVEAGFTWVWYEDSRHVHASISSPSLTSCIVESVEVSPETATGDQGESVTFTATAFDADGGALDPQPTFEWSFPGDQPCATACEIAPSASDTASVTCEFSNCSCVAIEARVGQHAASAYLALTGNDDCPPTGVLTAWACSILGNDDVCSCTSIEYAEGTSPPIAPGTPNSCPDTIQCCYVGSDPNGCLCANTVDCTALPSGTVRLESCPPP